MVPTVFDKTQARARKSIFCVNSYKNVAVNHFELKRDKLKIHNHNRSYQNCYGMKHCHHDYNFFHININRLYVEAFESLIIVPTMTIAREMTSSI